MSTGSEVTYGEYLQLDKLLGAQKVLSEPPVPDELLFIIVHQCFELWFKQLLHELDLLIERLAADDVHRSARTLRRCNVLLHVFDAQLGVLETMSPAEFARFRDRLLPASGFQSWQFREVEFVCGNRDARYLQMHEGNAPAQTRLKARLAAPSLWDAFCALLARRGFAPGDEAAQRGAIVRIYTTDDHPDLLLLCEELIELDERFSLWRQHHVRMAERMIGSKPGTGRKLGEKVYGKGGPMGHMGVQYLQTTLSKRFFPILWEARTEL
jgi:tryptophan 2,3-dioxygenase